MKIRLVFNNDSHLPGHIIFQECDRWYIADGFLNFVNRVVGVFRSIAIDQIAEFSDVTAELE